MLQIWYVVFCVLLDTSSCYAVLCVCIAVLNVELPNVMNELNHKTLCILDYVYVSY